MVHRTQHSIASFMLAECTVKNGASPVMHTTVRLLFGVDVSMGVGPV